MYQINYNRFPATSMGRWPNLDRRGWGPMGEKGAVAPPAESESGWFGVGNTFLGVLGDVVETAITDERAPAESTTNYYDQTTTAPATPPADDTIGGLGISPWMLAIGGGAALLGLFLLLK